MDARGYVAGVFGFYLMLGLAAYGWVAIRGVAASRLVAPGTAAGWPVELPVGLAFGLLVVAVGRILDRRYELARRLSDELRSMIPPMSGSAIAVTAVASSVGEELFFRGAMQDALGIWPTVAIFAVLHGLFIQRLRAWMVFAGLVGIAFGWMVEVLGTILAPIIAHFTINYMNLHALQRGRDEAP